MRSLKRFLYTTPIILIMVLSLVLLTYVGLGEAQRRYLPFQLAKLSTQAEIVQNAFDQHLKAGLALKQFAGFNSTAEAILRADPTIENIRVTDARGRVVFSAFNEGLQGLARAQSANANGATGNGSTGSGSTGSGGSSIEGRQYTRLSSEDASLQSVLIEESAQTYKVVQVLDSRFGVMGQVHIEARKDRLTSFLHGQFKTVFYLLAGLSIGYALFVALTRSVPGKQRRRQTLLQIGFIGCFLAMSVTICVVVFNVYEHGAKSSTRALADVMSQRLQSVLELGVQLDSLTGISDAMSEYKQGNPDVDAIALISDGVCIAHTDPARIGERYSTPSGSLEYVNWLSRAAEDVAPQLRVAVTIPRDVVMNAVLASAKNFIVLFVACLLCALIFLNAGRALMGVADQGSKEVDDAVQADDDSRFRIGLSLVQPAYFMIVFVSAMSISFLPQLAGELASAANAAAQDGFASASLPFTIYYLVFALVLLPAGHLAERMDLKRLMAVGFLFEVAGLAGVALASDFWMFVLARGCSGCGQGIFLIGLQSYVTAVTPRNRRSLGHSVKVVGRNAGLIAGTAIGALLFAFTDYRTLFMLSSVVSLAAMLYMLLLVPGVARLVPTAAPASSASILDLFVNVGRALRDPAFMQSLLLIGISGKIAIAGVVMFAVPLVLSTMGYVTEDIGLALMLFYMFSIIATRAVTRVVDKDGATGQVLVASAVLCGLALLTLGVVANGDTQSEGSLPGYAQLAILAPRLFGLLEATGISIDLWLLLAIVLVGVSNGLLTAPVMTHINKLPLSERNGVNSIAATYVFLERFGHVVGPVLVAWLLAQSGQSPLAISIFGLMMLGCALLFALSCRFSRAPRAAVAPASGVVG
ncbi:MAG: MFS transporter [Gammaproteobacteria bacterium]|nr:MFS transporter [Gammaproteobacteria bacterium]